MEKPTKGLAVDGSTRGNPGPSKYRIFDLEQNKFVYESEWIGITTNNITEFLAVCHAIHLVQKEDLNTPIYSDSVTALAWVKNKKANSNCKNLNERVKKAEKFLEGLSFNPVIEKWHTSMWGETPADYGHKK